MRGAKDNVIATVIAVAMIALVFACIRVGGPVGSCIAAAPRTNSPLLSVKTTALTVTNDTNVTWTFPEYPFKRPVKLDGVYLGSLATNVIEEPGTNGEIIRVLNVVAKLSIQAVWDSNILQWNYDKPVSQITNRYKLVR